MSQETPDVGQQTAGRRIRKILIANRGEIARRITRTCRDMGIAVVAVFSDPDAAEPFVAEADESVHLPGSIAADTYLDQAKILDAALAARADAIHPGYGFLSENGEFAAACREAGLVFIGPTPEAIVAMGSKIEAKRLMAEAGVPILASADVAAAATGDLADVADSIGYPILVKASAGGGGKGMRIVTRPEGLAEAVDSARREAASAFGDESLMLERYLDPVRHVEFQVFGDETGNVVHLFERECSIQRRHQKIIEESPSPALDDELRSTMGAAAVAAAKAVGYVGAGTVEFLLDGRDFFFLEMNTRLQVEHPVTELTTGLDLVAAQIRVARGESLPADLVSATASGHAIEARLYAEDPANGFLPMPGRLVRLSVPAAVRTDAGPGDGSTVSAHYDPMIAKVAAHAATRADAAAKLAKALTEAEIYGLTTNRNLLVRILDSDEFLAGETTTSFLEDADLAVWSRPLDADHRANAVAATLAAQAERRAAATVLATIPSGWRNAPSGDNVQRWESPVGAIEVRYRFDRDGLSVMIDGETVGARLYSASADTVDLDLDGIRRTYRVHRSGSTYWVGGVAGQSELGRVGRFPAPGREEAAGSLISPMPGKIAQVAVAEGAPVRRGDVVVIVEAMKMEHTVRAPSDGVVTSVLVTQGEQVSADQVLAVVAEAASE